MRDDYLKAALKTIDDPNILVNVVSRRVKQLRRGSRPLVESLEKLTAEDTALREIIEGKISYEEVPRREMGRRSGTARPGCRRRNVGGPRSCLKSIVAACLHPNKV